MRAKVPSSYLLATVALGICVFPDSVTAQITSDGSLSTTVSTDDGVNFLIENGDISGSNLFHSFLEFSIPNLGEAYFNNAIDITNIFSRVTGGNISEIQGLIRANGTANLFLINPAEIVFGENASLDVGGSFFATTAESVVFGDGIEFSATQPQEAPLLTINITPGIQFGNNPGIIQVQGSGHQIVFDIPTLSFIRDARSVGLQVPSGKTLALIGGNISLQGGNLTAPGGRVELGSVAESARVELIPTDDGFSTQYDGITNFGSINLSQAASVEVSGEGGGNIQLQGRQISLIEDSAIIADTLGTENGGLFSVKASEFVEIMGSNLPIFPTGFFNQVAPDARGNGGNMTIETPQLTVSGASLIRASTSGIGHAGNLTIDTESLLLLDGGQVSTTTTDAGNSGNLTVRASEKLEIIGILGDFIASGLFSSVQRQATGNGGNLNIETNLVRVVEGGTIQAGTLAAGNGGNLSIQATEVEVSDGFLELSGGRVRGSSVEVSVTENATGNGGSLMINAHSLRVSNGAQVTAATLGAGDAGNLTLNVDEIEVSGVSDDGEFISNISAFSETNFAAGSVNINTNNLTVSDHAQITVSNTDTGDAGNLNINAENIFLDSQGSLQGEVVAGDQANINLNSQFLLLRNNSNITTNAGEQATGGNIDIATVNLVALEDSDITANAFEGRGGNIIITAQGLFLSLDSDITASSQRGIDGVVTLNTPEADNSAAIIQLPTTFTDPSQQIAQGCAWTITSSFYVTGRGGMPEDPTAIISVQDILSDVRSSPNSQSSVTSHQSLPKQETIVEANAWIINEKGNVELVAIVTPQDPRYESLQATCAGK